MGVVIFIITKNRKVKPAVKKNKANPFFFNKGSFFIKPKTITSATTIKEIAG